MRSNDEIIHAVLRGDPAVFEELVRRYERAAWTTAWNVLQDYHSTQDATQNAFLAAYRRLAQLRKPALFGVWLLRITRREALRMARNVEPAQSLEEACGVVARDETRSAPRDESELLSAIGRLPDHERLVISLRYLDSRCIAEVAQLTGRPVGTVTKQLSRAIARLTKFLKEA